MRLNWRSQLLAGALIALAASGAGVLVFRPASLDLWSWTRSDRPREPDVIFVATSPQW
jgi:hypothetical protein